MVGSRNAPPKDTRSRRSLKLVDKDGVPDKRTKSRIAELEAQLEDFKKGDIDASAATLMAKLDQAVAERVRLDGTLKSLEKIIASHRSSQLQDSGRWLLETGGVSKERTPSFTMVPQDGLGCPPVESEGGWASSGTPDVNSVVSAAVNSSEGNTSMTADTENSTANVAELGDGDGNGGESSCRGLDSYPPDISCAALRIRLKAPNMTHICPCHPLSSSNPSQNLAHPYAINFFGWPGLRERFIFAEHSYCDNAFYDVLCSSLRIRWPLSFRDCYVRQADTNLCSISPTFSQCIYDLRNWAMGPDIFERYPEFRSDLPTLHERPHPVSNLQQLQFAGSRPNAIRDTARVHGIGNDHDMGELSELFGFGTNILLPNESASVDPDILRHMLTSCK
ncbi:uncharacterized protein BP5553_10309 [Venustampulla echinocandica]|uniref:Uncharacterized protein n=1 Tax=Venustampulla echinocandica TaxID=2656787 RepID=A0A370T9X0_9HELO|nr:uncharacterized protein BP5553_10309 [Venustampulla echinocandica]RDL30431.1 hypothetical protein BP5553_10309 [Venustampulla echinocandica]